MVSYFEECKPKHKEQPKQDVECIVASYFHSLLCKLREHTNNSGAHVTEEQKAKWDNKADASSINSINATLDKLESKEKEMQETVINDLHAWVTEQNYVSNSDMIKYVTTQINKVVTGELAVEGVATQEWVQDLIASMTSKGGDLDLSKYVLKSDFDSTKLEMEESIQNIEKKVTVATGSDYEITEMSVKDNVLSVVQPTGGTKKVELPAQGILEEDADKKYIGKNTLNNLNITINGTKSTYNPENGPLDVNIETGSGSGTGENGGYYKPYFQNNTSNEVAPALPDTGKSPKEAATVEGRSWTEDAINREEGEYTWMTQVFITGAGSYEYWSKAICITGDKGSKGEDSDVTQFIYQRTKASEQPDSPDNDQSNSTPYNWTDSPTGITEEWTYEWMCTRTLTNGTWGAWSTPVVWAHWGKSGTDGDGVEYIYYKGYGTPTANLPSSWYTNEESKAGTKGNTDGYIPEDQKALWFDNPPQISQGEKTYVSIRKKQDGYWHTYGAPTVWSYYANDGIAGDAIKLQLDSPTVYVNTNTDGYCCAYSGTVGIHFYNNTDEVTSINTIESVTRSDGKAITGYESWLSIDGKTIAIKLEENQIKAANIIYTAIISGTASTGGKDGVVRKAQLQVAGVRTGEDGCSYELKLSTSVVKESDGERLPSEISISCLKTKGGDSTVITPSESSEFEFWCYENGSSTGYQLTDDTFDSWGIPNVSDSASTGGYITIALLRNNVEVDRKTVQVLKDGTPGTNGISYSIDVYKTTLTKYVEPKVVSGDISFKVKKIQGSTITYLDGYIACELYFGDNVDDYPATYEDGFWTSGSIFELTVGDGVCTVIKVYGDNNVLLASTVVPFIIPGKDGKDGKTQPIAGAPLRMLGDYAAAKESQSKEESTYTFLDGKRAASVDNGVMYQDVVLYDNVYYVCVNTDLGKADNWNTQPSAAKYWSQISLTSDQMCNILIANKAFIKELSSNEVVIMDDKTIVAGMTSGSAIDTGSSNIPSETTKGDIRIWAGEFSDANLATAPFTVSNTGHVKMEDCEMQGFITHVNKIINDDNFEQYLVKDKDGDTTYAIDFNKAGAMVSVATTYSAGDEPLVERIDLPSYDGNADSSAKFLEAAKYIGSTVIVRNRMGWNLRVGGLLSGSATVDIAVNPGQVIVATCVAKNRTDLQNNITKVGWEYVVGYENTNYNVSD